MSTPTPIQAHITYGLPNHENPAGPASDMKHFGYLPKAREDAAEDGESSKEIAPIKGARKVTLDDLGGRSDALGG
jgi:hypothetical protein